VIQMPLDPREVDRAFGRETPAETAELKKIDSPPATIDPNDTATKEPAPLLPPNETLDEIARGVQLDDGSKADG
jgi:hypothetical protein